MIRLHPQAINYNHSTKIDKEDELETVEFPSITLSEAAWAWKTFQSFIKQNFDYEHVHHKILIDYKDLSNINKN